MSRNRSRNVGKVSKWYTPDKLHELVVEAHEGDRLEFDRGMYKHWAVYVGYRETSCSEGRKVPSVVHRSNDAINGGFSNGSIAVSNKGAYGIGDVVLQPLSHVCENSSVRINNSLDSERAPLPTEEIIERVLKSNDRKTKISRRPYNLLTNNCEDFASWSRNDTAISQQVNDGVMIAGLAVAGLAVVVGGALALASVTRTESHHRSADSDSD